MNAVIIDGQAIALKVRGEITKLVSEAKARYGEVPGIAVVLVGDDVASQIYVASKEKVAVSAGMRSVILRLPASVSEKELLTVIEKLNYDTKIHGILIQLPLPEHINAAVILSAVSPLKDVDGFHPQNVGKLYTGEKSFVPCTPLGIMKLLKEYGINLVGKRAVVIGRSNIVGKPMSALLLTADATVTICHSKTKDLPDVCREADILVVAIGKARMITKDYVRDGAVVIDAGINRLNGRICGDADFENLLDAVSAITPVPKGVGPMTIAMLISNTLQSFMENIKS
ncbi:MAG: bifunctional methylenetetrahydrofolate dehydrogenase/methenyltetrahydrofolate cyclohydrolase FolD [Deferribacteraceae bacterium]|jgi:methylenetetrahydrofolate dehydrogenase (NADP+)/methenyltetrahydrofolate cyclohydrolase|nr:bifunctional methylenetetrahydrofolate dehydrogenase/methenyltetrahydrofolate cyclohydrolase FolD [Deferribacteraceae bacterium]